MYLDSEKDLAKHWQDPEWHAIFSKTIQEISTRQTDAVGLKKLNMPDRK